MLRTINCVTKASKDKEEDQSISYGSTYRIHFRTSSLPDSLFASSLKVSSATSDARRK